MKIEKTRFVDDITLIHENGYRGRFYGESSMSIWDKGGKRRRGK